jgi:hypothetical protein
LPSHNSIELTPVQASDWIQVELSLAAEALDSGNLDSALDAYVRALGLALQLGPAPTERALDAVLQSARTLARREDAAGLSALGPAMVGLTRQAREAGALPVTSVMEAWADVVDGLGALIGQVGLVVALPQDRRPGMLVSALDHARLLDDATGGLFGLAEWFEEMAGPMT